MEIHNMHREKVVIVVLLVCIATLYASSGSADDHKSPCNGNKALSCGTQLQYGTISNFYNSGSFGQAVRWDAGTDACSLVAVSLVIYQAASSTPDSAGIIAFVWSDDGMGLPGAVLACQYVSHSMLVFYPNTTDIHFIGYGAIIVTGQYHTGYLPNSSNDIYAGLTDNGSGGANASSSLWLNGSWIGNGSAFPQGDVNWVQEISTCCTVPCGQGFGCSRYIVQRWGDCHYLVGPTTSSDAKAMRFSIPDSNSCEGTGRLAGLWPKSVLVFLGNSSAVSQVGTGGVVVKVWSDSVGYPASELATVHVPHELCRFAPIPTVVDLSTRCDLNFDRNTDFHVSCEPFAPETDVYPLLCDDGDLSLNRATQLVNGAWTSAESLYAPKDYNWSIQVMFGPDRCGDTDLDGENLITASDIVFLMNYIFSGGAAPCHWHRFDADCDGEITIGDEVFLMRYVYLNGPSPCANCN